MPGNGGGMPNKITVLIPFSVSFGSFLFALIYIVAETEGRVARQGNQGDVTRHTAGEAKGRKSLAGLVLKKHRVRMGLALGSVRRSNRVNDGLGLFVTNFCTMDGTCQWRDMEKERERHKVGTNAGNSLRRCAGGFGRCCGPCAPTWSRA